MARKKGRGQQRGGTARQSGSNTASGSQHGTTASATTPRPDSKGKRRERRDFPGYGAPLPWAAPSEANNGGGPELRHGVASAVPAKPKQQKVDSPLPTVNPARQHAGTSVMGSSVVFSVDGHNEATAPPKADIPLAYQISARAGSQPIPKTSAADSWIVRLAKCAAQAALAPLKIASAGARLLVRTAWATARQVTSLAMAPFCAVKSAAQTALAALKIASAGARLLVRTAWAIARQVTSLVMAPLRMGMAAARWTLQSCTARSSRASANSPTGPSSQPVAAVEPTQPLPTARSEPPMLAHQLESAVHMLSSTVPSSPMHAHAASPQGPINQDNSSSAALLDAPAMQLAAPEPAVPTLPAAVPILQLAAPEPVGRAARGAFGTGLCWYHLELEAEMEAALSKPIVPRPGQGANIGPQRHAAPVRPSQGCSSRAHCQTGPWRK